MNATSDSGEFPEPPRYREPSDSARLRGADEVLLSPQWEVGDPRDRSSDALARWQGAPVEQLITGPAPVRRRLRLPVILFLLTMASTFIAGVTGWAPHAYIFNSDNDPVPLRKAILQHWDTGLIYMASLLAMLFAHEMGHFLATLYYRIPASFPYFLPLPITPIGTLGAVIRMDNRDANRKQMFDIGIAGPLAGLVVAVPLLIIGVAQLDLSQPGGGEFKLGVPLGLRLLMQQMLPAGHNVAQPIDIAHVNPYLMAGWVGLLVTALNMMPVSQLDGGHVTYTLFGKPAHWIARTFMVFAIAYMVYTGTYQMVLMAGIILLIGIDHPPTSDDEIPLGGVRYGIGIASLVIPILCLTVEPILPG
jgi:Zn-dependent protease